MKELWRQWLEIALLAVLLAACLILGFLQYRWTGELSRAETERLLDSAQGRLQDLARAFDAELRREVMALVPSGDAVERFGAEPANNDLLARAAADPERRPVFRRIAAAVRGDGHRLRFFVADMEQSRFLAAPWPEDGGWPKLRERLEDIALGGSPRGPILDPNSALIEVPVFAGESESEWVLFELDTRYVASEWLPQLTRTYVNSEAEETFHVGVFWSEDPSRWVLRPPGGGAALG